MKNFEFETESVNLNEPINQEVGKTTIDTSIGVDLDAPSMSMLNKPENKKITFLISLKILLKIIRLRYTEYWQF